MKVKYDAKAKEEHDKWQKVCKEDHHGLVWVQVGKHGHNMDTTWTRQMCP